MLVPTIKFVEFEVRPTLRCDLRDIFRTGRVQTENGLAWDDLSSFRPSLPLPGADPGWALTVLVQSISIESGGQSCSVEVETRLWPMARLRFGDGSSVDSLGLSHRLVLSRFALFSLGNRTLPQSLCRGDPMPRLGDWTFTAVNF